MNKKLIITFTVGIFLLGMMELIVSGILELMSSDLGISHALTGQLITVYAVSFALFGPILIRLTENMPAKIVVLLSLIVFIIGNVVFGLAETFLVLSIGRVITAMAAAVFIVKILDMTVMLSEPRVRGKMLALVYMGFSAANVFGIPIGTIIGAQFGWRVIFLMVIILAILVGLGVIFFVRSQDLTDRAPAGAEKSRLKSKKNVALYIAVTLCVLIGNYIILGYISPLMTSHGFTLENVSFALLTTGIGGMTGTYLGGNLIDKIGPKKTVMIMMSLFLVSMAIMPFLYETPILFYINIFVWSLFQWSTSPAVQGGLVENVEGSSSNVFSWNMSALNLGIGVGAVIGGVFISNFDISYGPWLGFVIVLCGLIAATQIKPQHV
ncbi:Purine efflux pump PbuE [Jeotgalicoccus aerolatus]|uniref:MFS family arabinose efflux permease n=1 Tax=Jeotgalicoccus aerolatus TaxID=709510 RepID=A0ABS4HNP5_9STAP|nr:MFS transporter [Jeotgalicoccus aerolatus]MBP1952557.1 putative MFS family arabinose efflux permease [Jeotgalicoccus aerolatus]GGD92755.1 chloramphenicol resistance protein [Jeotgalicoccus aerolatus]CAD2074475.1 Purine efflux pump PbuE [Jeotgalicoccus aerolatus]